MNFVSISFLLFFIVVIFLLLLFKKQLYKKIILVLSGCFFYAYWDFRFLGLLIFITILNYVFGKMINRSTSNNRKINLVIGITMNLVILGFFKYFNFFIDSLNSFLVPLGLNLGVLQLILPIGISFFTFEAISYLVDIYRYEYDSSDSFIDFSLFMFFFPRMISGPIIRPADFLPQLKSNITIGKRSINEGIQLFILGVLKKVVVADRLAYFVDPVFGSPSHYDSLTIWLAVICYAIQIYCDFSGYTDMAIGTAKCLGFTIPQNFNMPYTAFNISEFWHKWHISLSTWLRDYLYIPLGGNRKGTIRTYLNLIITMLLGGLWHGASWNFVVWGGLHGIGLSINKLYQSKTRNVSYKNRYIYKLICLITTFLFVCFCWIFFRSRNFSESLYIIRKMIIFGDCGIKWYYSYFFILTPIIIVAHIVGINLKNKKILLPLERIWGLMLFIIIVLTIIVMYPQSTSPFIYFQF